MSDQITESGMLEVGVVVLGSEARSFVLRAARLSDTYKAASVVPVPEDIGVNVAARVAYEMAVSDANVLCQLVALGDLNEIPSLRELVEMIDPDDMAIIRDAAERLKKKLRPSKDGSAPSVSPNASSSAPASP